MLFSQLGQHPNKEGDFHPVPEMHDVSLTKPRNLGSGGKSEHLMGPLFIS